MFKRLSTHVVLSTMIALIISSLLAFIFANMFYHVKLKPANDERIMEILKEQKNFISHHPEISADNFFGQMAALNYQVIALNNGKKQFYGTPFRVKNLPTRISGDYHGIKERPFNLLITGFFDNETRNTVGTTMKVHGETYQVFIRPDVGESMGEFRIFLAVLLLLLLLFTAVLIYISARYIVQPVTKLQQYAAQIKRGDYSKQAAVERRDEIGMLAREMEQMSSAIQTHQEQNARFVANVSHEIQSPITNLIGLTARMKDDKNGALIESIEHQSLRLSHLTKQLLVMNFLENSGEVAMESFSAREMINEVIQTFIYQLEHKELMLVTDIDHFEWYANRQMIIQLVTNLVSNAIKYTENEGSIKISLKKEKTIKLIVKDSGKGMSEEIKLHIFERFYKADVLEDKVPSNGLGMSIVKEIVNLHHAEIKVESERGKGTEIIVNFPALFK